MIKYPPGSIEKLSPEDTVLTKVLRLSCFVNQGKAVYIEMILVVKSIVAQAKSLLVFPQSAISYNESA